MKHFSVALGPAQALLGRGAILTALLTVSCGGDERSVQEGNANQGGEASTGGASGSGGSAETGGAGADTGGTPATGGSSTGGAGASAGGVGGHDAGAGGSPTAGAGGGGSGGVPGTGGVATGGAGGSPNTCNPPCGSGTPVCENGSCVQCATGSGRCNGDAPDLCEGGQWVTKPTCSGNAPACSNGVCGSVKLTGGIASVADGVLKTTTVRLVEHGLERWPTACGDVRGAPVCITGGIGP